MARSEHVAVVSEQVWRMLTNDLRLSTRQAEIARLISDGMSDKQIAWQLGISFGTLRTHVSRLFQKCHVNDRLELLAHLYAALNESRENHAMPLPQREGDTNRSDPLWIEA